MLLLVPGAVLIWIEKMHFGKFPKRYCSACGGFLFAVFLKVFERIHDFGQLAEIRLREQTA